MTGLARVSWWRRLFGLGAPRLEASPAPPALAPVDLYRQTRLGKGGPAGAIDEGPVNTWREWTPDLLRLAEISADRGDLSLAADLCDALVADAFIASKLGERVRSLVGAPLVFVEGQGRRRGAAKRALEAGEDFWRLLPDAEYAQLVGWGVMLGAGLLQFRDWAPAPQHGGRLLPSGHDVWHMRNARFDWQTRRWLVRDAGGRDVEVVSGTGQWLLFTPFGRERPWVHGLWRQVAKVWMLKQLAILEWQVANQKNGARVVTAQLPTADDAGAMDDYTSDYRRKLVAELRTLGRNGVVALKPGLDLKLLEVGAESWESFKLQCELCDELVAVAFVGSSLSTSGDKASYASSQTGQEVKRDIRAADANVECTLLHDDVMVPWATWNFGDAGAAPWPTRELDAPPTPAEQNAALEGFGKAIKSLREDAGLPVDAEEMAKKRPDIILLSPDKRTKSPAPLYQYIVENPLLTVNEIRGQLGWPRIDGGDVFPSELAAQLAPKPEPPGEGAPPGGDDGQDGPEGPPREGGTKGKSKGLARAPYAKGGRFDGPAVEGQLYADRLVDAARPLGPRAFRDVLVETIAAVEAARDYDELRGRLVELAGEASLEADARELLEHLALMAWSAGAYEGARELDQGADA